MKIYVAGKFGDKKEIQSVQQALIENSHSITHDWTQYEHTHDETKYDIAEFAAGDVNGVKSADTLLIYITDADYDYKGTNVELGVALGCGIPVCIIDTVKDSKFSKNIFTKHGLVSYYENLESFITVHQVI